MNTRRFPRLRHFKNVIDPLSHYYDQTKLQIAVDSLRKFYKDEGFESDQIVEDWTPNDFENCFGIDVFVDALNYSDERVNSESNKRILFEWVCYLLLPKQTLPSHEPLSNQNIIHKDCNSACKGTHDLKCPIILRLIGALHKYETMSNEDFLLFIEYIDGGINVLNDFNHLILCHNDNLQKINERMLSSKKCLFKECKSVRRHFENENDCFYVSVFDSLHVWLYHCFDAGFRLKEKVKREKKRDDGLFDAEFDRIHGAIRKTDSLTAPFERINSTKFNICQKTKQKPKKGDTTCIDELFRYLAEMHKYFAICQFSSYFLQEMFDTDSLKMDVKYYGNVKKKFKKQSEEIMRFIKMNGDKFSVGVRFYYWDYYKYEEEIEHESDNNVHDHSGYTVCDLVIRPKYSSFKKEALNYKHFDVNMYKRKAKKAKKYSQTAKIKKAKAKETDSLHYGIKWNDVIQFGHLVALILYCDLTKLSTEFSSTFRRVTKYETLQSMKQRNALFYWMSRYLRELVEIFGQCSYGDRYEQKVNGDGDYIKPLNALHGPFYCGMSCKMNVDAFSMRLNGPTSTSKQFEVAVKFSGPQGMLFTFDNPKNDLQYRGLRGWNCSWISNFKQEDEILFFGGSHPIKVVTVRLMETKSNYRKYIEAIWYFDSMLNAAYMEDIHPSKNTYFIVSNLINYVLKKPVRQTFDEYIIGIFLCFANNKKRIILNLGNLDGYGDAKMNSLILSSLDKRERTKEIKREDTDFRNLFLPNLLRIFPNAQTMIIWTTCLLYSYSFSLVALLSLISDSNLKTIIIKAEKGGTIWTEILSLLWEAEETLKELYAAKSFILSAKEDNSNTFIMRIDKYKSCY